MRELDQTLALLRRQRVAGGVLEIGDDVGELRLRPGEQHALERGDVDAVVLELDGADIGAALLERQQRTVVRRLLDDHRVALGNERVEQECVRLHRAVRDDHLLGLDAVALGNPLAQRLVSDGGPISGETARVICERSLGGGL